MVCSGLERVSKAERRAIARHRAELSAVWQREVSEEEATEHWFANCHQSWLEERQARMLAMQREEMLRHKWLMSEKYQRDVGAEAIFDWIKRYAADWREWFEENQD